MSTKKLTEAQRKILGSLARHFPMKTTIYGRGPHAAAEALRRRELVSYSGLASGWIGTLWGATQAGVDLARELGLLETKEPPTGVNTL